MYLYKQKKPNGDIYLAVKEKYHVPGKGARERTIERIGYLSELKDKYDDPIAHFSQYAKDLTAKVKADKNVTLDIKMNKKMTTGTNSMKNVGYVILKEIYRRLEINKFWNWKTAGRKMRFSTAEIFRLLVLSRALYPCSKRATLKNSGTFFEPHDISLDDVYNALDVIGDNQKELQEWIFKHSESICGKRDVSTSYFDCTNYYFDIGRPDVDFHDEDGTPVDKDGNPTDASYRKRGPEKNHRPDPIVEMGLLLDSAGIPVAYDLFPGNESEKVHMLPMIRRVKNRFSNTRIVAVADRGLNTSDNIYYLAGDNREMEGEFDGYVYGQSVRGADAEFKEWVLSGNYSKDTVKDKDGNDVVFTHKSRIYPKTLNVNVEDPKTGKKKKKKVLVDQKQMVYYSKKYADKQKSDRDAMIVRAQDLIKHPKKYDRINAKGSASYVINIAFDKTSGAVVEGRSLSLDIEKIKEEEKYDGYYSIVTSELKMDDFEIRKVYRGLARIEDSFRVTKTFLDSRPIYVRTNKHIDAHFATCFTALVIIRLLEKMLDNKYPPGQILDSLKKYCCDRIGTNLWHFTYYDEIIADCGKALGMTLDNEYRRQNDIRRLLRY